MTVKTHKSHRYSDFTMLHAYMPHSIHGLTRAAIDAALKPLLFHLLTSVNEIRHELL
jgi:hypothetical protein